jgi:hypothetical protein
MAISLENANKTWQRVNIALANASPAAQKFFKALKQTLAQDYRNKDLEFVDFTEVDADVAGGTVLVDAACRIVGVYVKKEDEGTDNMVFFYDDATNDGTAGDAVIGLALREAEEEAFAFYPAGVACGTGVVVTQYNDGIGGTDGSNGGNGFLIIAAP